MKTLRIVAAGACLSVGASHPALAADAAPEREADTVDTEQMARDPAWLALLHYRARSDGSMLSQADRPQFFLSPDGKHSPAAELLANMAAVRAPGQRQQFACRFPARYEWLRQRLGQASIAAAGHGDAAGHANADGRDTADNASANGGNAGSNASANSGDVAGHASGDDADALLERCEELAPWLARFPGRRISINFASSYLESPSSTFGHTFLKVYQNSGSELLSPTINYAARTEARDSDLAFIFKGLFGGFPGVADELPFYRRLRTYADTEGRDIHEYALALEPHEVRRLLLHTWEIKDGVFDYDFLHENCAYRTLSLIDAARPGAGLLKRFGKVTVPVDTVRALRAGGMLGGHRVWQSASKRVRDLEARVPKHDASAAHAIALGQSDIDSDNASASASSAALQPMTAPQRAGTLQLAYEYASILIDRDEGERATRKAILGAITRARMELDNPEPLAVRASPATPEDGHDGGLIGIGLRRHAGRTSASLEYAAFQHTLTNPLPGYEPHAEITVLNPELQLGGGQARVRRVDWLVAQSSIPSSTLFQPRAWRFQLVTRPEPYAQRERMATSLSYHSGKAWRLGRDTVLSVLPGARLEAGAGLDHRAGLAGALNATVTRQGLRWSAQLELQAEKFVAGSTLRRQLARASAEFALSRNVSLAIGAARSSLPRKSNELLVSLKWRQRSLGDVLGRD